jgi:hypothetical protein
MISNLKVEGVNISALWIFFFTLKKQIHNDSKFITLESQSVRLRALKIKHLRVQRNIVTSKAGSWL